jgi:hypothetical protein
MAVKSARKPRKRKLPGKKSGSMVNDLMVKAKPQRARPGIIGNYETPTYTTFTYEANGRLVSVKESFS